MSYYVNLILAAFFIAGLLAIAFSLKMVAPILLSFILSGTRSRRNKQSKSDFVKHRKDVVDKSFEDFKSNDPSVQGNAFVNLMKVGYISLHLLCNKGNCYNDNTQPIIYGSFLTPDCISALFSVEGKDAGY